MGHEERAAVKPASREEGGMKTLRESGFPRANWFFIRMLPSGTTAQDLSEWFRERGIDIPLSHVSVKEHSRGCTAIVAVPKTTLLTLLTWAINGGTFQG